MLPKNWVISKKKQKVITSLAVTNYALRDQIVWIEVAFSRKHYPVHLLCNREKGRIKSLRGPDPARGP